MKAFRVAGHFKMGHNANQPFVKEFAASSPQEAEERVYSDLGSRHGVKRLRIHVDKIEEIAADDVQSPAVRHVLQRGA